MRSGDLDGEAVGISEDLDEEVVRELAASAFAGPVSTELNTITAYLEPQKAKAFGKHRLRFFHKSFQDFFAARWLRGPTGFSGMGPPSVLEFSGPQVPEAP